MRLFFALGPAVLLMALMVAVGAPVMFVLLIGAILTMFGIDMTESRSERGES